MTTSMMESREQWALSRLWRVGGLAIAAAVIANLIIRTLGVAIFNVPESFLPLQVGSTVMFTVIGVLGAVITFAIIARVTRNPARVFRIVALVVLILSFIPDFFLLDNPMFPGASVGAIATLMLEHVAAAAISVGLLTTRRGSR
jgi:hypothetical protein